MSVESVAERDVCHHAAVNGRSTCAPSATRSLQGHFDTSLQPRRQHSKSSPVQACTKFWTQPPFWQVAAPSNSSAVDDQPPVASVAQRRKQSHLRQRQQRLGGRSCEESRTELVSYSLRAADRLDQYSAKGQASLEVASVASHGLATPTATLEGLATHTKTAAALPAGSANEHWHLFGNVTTISEQVKVFLESSCTEFGSLSFVETHTPREDAPKLTRLLKNAGFVSSQASASSGNNHGTKGGAVTAVRPHLECNLKAPSWAAKGTRMKGHDWTAAVHRFGKVSIVIFSAYFHTGHGTETINNNKFNQILRTKRSLGLPSILVADFNCTPSQVEAKLWTRLFEGFLLVPEVDFTCTSGNTNRILDFALVSFDLQGIVSIFPLLTTPWSPHISLLISILMKPCTVLANQCRMPKQLPSLKELRKGDSFKEAELKWDPRDLFSYGEEEIKGTTEEAITNWARKMENNILGRAGIKQTDRKQYLGRCQKPVFQLKTVAPITGSVDGAARAASCTMWAQLAARLKEWKQLMGKTATQGRIKQSNDLRRVFGRIGKKLIGETSSPGPLTTDLNSSATREWGHWLGCIDLWNESNVDAGILAAQKMYSREAFVRSTERRNGFSKWVFDMTKDGIKSLHNLTKEEYLGENMAGSFDYSFYDSPTSMLKIRTETLETFMV